MKKIFLFSMLVTIFSAFIACDKEDEDPINDNVENTVSGIISVESEENFSDTTMCSYNIAEDKINIALKDVKFSSRMPITVSPSIEGIPCSKIGENEWSFAADTIVPLLNGKEFPKYTATDIKGSIKEGKISFSLNFGDYPTTFVQE
jgi:hypothetical protein